MSHTTLFWFRQDLRIQDNPGLYEAARQGCVLPVYILDTDDTTMGGASKWWLHHSLQALMASGVPLKLFKGQPKEILQTLQSRYNCQGVYWNRQYDPYSIARDADIKVSLPSCHSYNGSLLYEPWTVLKDKGDFYKVFTPYWRAARCSIDPRSPLDQPHISYSDSTVEGDMSLEDLGLLPQNLDWPKKLDAHWVPGEESAHKALKLFVQEGLGSYKVNRDRPDLVGTSRLSPHLHFGEMSPHYVWEALNQAADCDNEHITTYRSELGWREFSYYLLYHVKTLMTEPFQSKFQNMNWEDNDMHLQAWQKGLTGYPIIDAGMRELWETGYMHNRVRMIVASFLTKHCLIHWTKGEQWFRDCLVDADLASNAASWQWVAGCGADAAPFFRIFNPVTQSEKFDPHGDYIRTYVPEVRGFSNKEIHKPFAASPMIQKAAGCIIGQDYPSPLIDLKFGRERALERFRALSFDST